MSSYLLPFVRQAWIPKTIPLFSFLFIFISCSVSSFFSVSNSFLSCVVISLRVSAPEFWQSWFTTTSRWVLFVRKVFAATAYMQTLTRNNKPVFILIFKDKMDLDSVSDFWPNDPKNSNAISQRCSLRQAVPHSVLEKTRNEKYFFFRPSGLIFVEK